MKPVCLTFIHSLLLINFFTCTTKTRDDNQQHQPRSRRPSSRAWSPASGSIGSSSRVAAALTGAILTVRRGWCSAEDTRSAKKNYRKQNIHLPGCAALLSIQESAHRVLLVPPARRDGGSLVWRSRPLPRWHALPPPCEVQPTSLSFSPPSLPDCLPPSVSVSGFIGRTREPDCPIIAAVKTEQRQRSTENSSASSWGIALRKPIRRYQTGCNSLDMNSFILTSSTSKSGSFLILQALFKDQTYSNHFWLWFDIWMAEERSVKLLRCGSVFAVKWLSTHL